MQRWANSRSVVCVVTLNCFQVPTSPPDCIVTYRIHIDRRCTYRERHFPCNTQITIELLLKWFKQTVIIGDFSCSTYLLASEKTVELQAEYFGLCSSFVTNRLQLDSNMCDSLLLCSASVSPQKAKVSCFTDIKSVM